MASTYRSHAATQHQTALDHLCPACTPYGAVARSISPSDRIASSRLAPHIASLGRKLTHTAGRSGFPKIAHRKSGNNCTHRSPAFFPCGIPGIGDEIEGAMQHAPQSGRQSMRHRRDRCSSPQSNRGPASEFQLKAA